MSRVRSYQGILVAPLALLALTCPAGPVESEITRDQAIDIARQEVSFEPESTEAVLTTSDDREVWRVTFQKPRICRSRCRVGGCETSARLFAYRLVSWGTRA